MNSKSNKYPVKFDDVKNKIIYRLGKNKQSEENSHILSSNYLNLKIYYYVLVERDNSVLKSYPITKDMLTDWKVDIDEIKEIALNNTTKAFPYTLDRISVLLKSLVSPDDEDYEELFSSDYNPPLYVLTNNLKVYGATCILYPDILEKVYKRINDDFYILPSSIHELIIVPKKMGESKEELEKMVINVNETQVLPEEFLSNSIYFYKHEENELAVV